MAVNEGTRRIVGGVDTYMDLHVAAVVDEQDRVIETRSLRHHPSGLSPDARLDAALGELQRIGVESTGAMAQAFSVSCSKPGLRFSRSQRRTSRIAADVARTTISMPRTRPMPPLQANGP